MCKQCEIEDEGAEPLGEASLAAFGENIAIAGHHIADVACDESMSWVAKLDAIHDAVGSLMFSCINNGPALYLALQAERARIARMN